MADFETARRLMVDNQLRTSNVTDRRILAAMSVVPRERFVPAAREALAYADTTHTLAEGRSLAAPAPFAQLIQLAEIQHTDRVLDVGAGSGYSTAVLAELAADVTGIEPDSALVAAAAETFAALGISNARVVQGDLDAAGQPRDGFDVIVIEGAVASEPSTYFPLLRQGGRLVALQRQNAAGIAYVYVKSGDEVAGRAAFNTVLPPLTEAPREVTFVF